MTDDRLPLAELMAKSGDPDFLRSVAESVLQILMEADVDGLIGAGRHERSPERATWRNGYRDRSLDTRLGTLNLKVPKLRTGSYFPGFLEPRKTVEKALVSVIQEAWIAGVSTRGVPTGYAAPPLARQFSSVKGDPPVWPTPDGRVRGYEFSPLYPSVPKAAAGDEQLYEVLALVDAIRDGRAREVALAAGELKARLCQPHAALPEPVLPGLALSVSDPTMQA